MVVDRELLEKELSQIQERRLKLEANLKQCKEGRDSVREKKIQKEISTLARRAKHRLFRLGRYRYPEEEVVKFDGGEMDANTFFWLKYD
jgi:hypothetical protein